jgi:hypothetical protein
MDKHGGISSQKIICSVLANAVCGACYQHNLAAHIWQCLHMSARVLIALHDGSASWQLCSRECTPVCLGTSCIKKSGLHIHRQNLDGSERQGFPELVNQGRVGMVA